MSTECDLAPALPLSGDNGSVALTPRLASRRVLHVVNGEHYSGAERVQDLLSEHMPAAGFEVGFACVKPGRFAESRHYRGAPVANVPMRSRLDLQCVSNLVRLIREQDHAIVHTHTPRSLLVGALAAKRAGVPLVYHVHSPTANDSTRRLRNLLNHHSERLCLRGVDRIIAVSPSLKERVIRDGYADQKVRYVANGVPSATPRSPEPPSGAWTIGMVALFRPRKGVEVLLEAFSELVSRGSDVRLLAVGPFESDEYQSEILALVDRFGVADRIEWTGFVRDVGEQLARMDLFALPSLFGEGLPMVVLEALAVGLPVVGTRVEGIPEAVRHGQEGLLVEPGSAGQLAAAVQEIASGGLDYSALSRSAVERHRERFSAEAMAAQVAEVYRELLRKRSA